VRRAWRNLARNIKGKSSEAGGLMIGLICAFFEKGIEMSSRSIVLRHW
jgi:hypothetical protein